MVDHFHGNSSGLGFLKCSGCVAAQRGPGFGVDLRLKSGLESAVWVVRTKEVRVPNEEAFFVVVRVNEPTRDPFWPVAPNLACLGVKHVNTVYLDANPVSGIR